jgi:alkylation response protein AidB-like acyl-CoA dehydrogenase
MPEYGARRAAIDDLAEVFPADICRRLDAAGLPAHYVPAQWGGALDSHESLLSIWADLARRDLSAIVAHGKTYLGAAPVWLAGDPRQAVATAEAVLGGTPISWALSEPEHGADLLNNALTATAAADGYRLDGRKWPVNNATRAGLLTVLARTGTPGSGRGHSLFLVDKSTLRPDAWRNLPKVRTHGVRGIDISGIEFSGAVVRASDLIGDPGTGVETVLRTLQLTRPMCSALSLGAGEHGLRIATRFATERIIQQRPLIERPYPRSVLARCAGVLAAVEAVALVAARSIHCLTQEMSVVSAVAKAVAPTLIDPMLSELAEILGVRSYLTTEYAFGAFQKLNRDHRVVAIFDGSTPVNRSALIQQFPRLGRALTSGAADEEELRICASPGTPLPPLQRSALTLLSRPGCSLVQSLAGLPEAVTAANAPDDVIELARAFRMTASRLAASMAQVRPAALPSMAAYELAAAYELCFAAAACLQLWIHGADQYRDEPLWLDAAWLRVALRVLLHRVSAVLREPAPESATADGALDDGITMVLAEAVRTGGPITPFGKAWPPADSETAAGA